MKSLIFQVLLIMFIPAISMGQNKTQMKAELFYGIKMYILPGREIKKYISVNKGVLDKEFSDINRVPTYSFSNGNYLYDFNAHAFLFTSKDDLIKFKTISRELADKEFQNQQINNLDEKFIKNVGPLILEFEGAYQIKFDVNRLDDLKKLDDLINHSQKKALFKTKWKNNLIAIVGQFIISHLHTAQWALNKVNGVSLVIITDEKMNFYNPIMIVDKEINYYLPEEGSVGFYDHAQIELIQYKAFDKLIK